MKRMWNCATGQQLEERSDAGREVIASAANIERENTLVGGVI